MTKDEIAAGAKAILEKRVGEKIIRVAVDSPKDSSETIKAFKRLGCKVKSENDGRMLVITRP